MYLELSNIRQNIERLELKLVCAFLSQQADPQFVVLIHKNLFKHSPSFC